MAAGLIIGERLARVRTRAGLTQEALAEISGVSVATIRKLEQNTRAAARVSTLHRLAVALGVETAELFGSAVTERANGTTHQLGLMALRRVLTPARGIAGVTFADDDEGAPDLGKLRASIDATNQLYHRDQYAAVSSAMPALVSEAQAAERELTGDEHDQALELLGQALQLAGSLLIQVRHYDLAYQALGASIDAVERAGKQVAAASGVVSLCWLFLRQGRFDEVEAMAVRTADEIEPRMSTASTSHVATWGWLLLRGSAAAIRNNRGAEADEMLRLARAAAARIGHDVIEYDEYWTSFGPSTVAMKAIENAIIARQPARALQLGRHLPPNGRPTSDNRNRCLLDLASAHVEERNRGEAIRILLDIRSSAPEWLRNQRYAQDILARIMEGRVRALSQQVRELADVIGVAH